MKFAAGGKQRLVALLQALLQEVTSADLLERLLAIVEGADELAVSRLRPYSLADGWGVGRRALLELCLLATRLGLLEFEWEFKIDPASASNCSVGLKLFCGWICGN